MKEEGAGKNKDHINLHLDHLDKKVIDERLPGISEAAKTFANVDVNKEPIPVVPRCIIIWAEFQQTIKLKS